MTLEPGASLHTLAQSAAGMLSHISIIRGRYIEQMTLQLVRADTSRSHNAKWKILALLLALPLMRRGLTRSYLLYMTTIWGKGLAWLSCA
jgi:hypothetical protein